MDSSDAQCAVVPALEEWRAVPGYEGRYEVSNQGRVRSLLRGIVRRPQQNTNGYLIVMLSDQSSKPRIRTIHSLVAEAFIGLRPENAVIDHADRNKQNNFVSNLRYTSRSKNGVNSARRSRCGYRGVQPHRRLFQSQISVNGTNVSLGLFKTAIEAAKAYDAMAKELHGSFAILNFPEVAK